MLRTISILFSLVLILCCSAAYAAPGDLDSTFDGDGKTTTDFNGSDDSAQDVVVQSDGKIIVGGFGGDGGGGDFALVRYNADGSLDTAFGTNGRVVTAISGEQKIFALALQPDGKIIAAGKGLSSACPPCSGDQIHRYNADGSLDSSFGGGDGIVGNSIPSGGVLYDVAIQPDGKIVAVGESVFANFVGFLVVRYNADGSLDTTFSGDGIVTYQTALLNQSAYAVALQADGKIVAGGGNGFGYGAWIRLNANGTPDGANSLLNAEILIRDAAIQPDGKILFAGTKNSSLETNFNNLAVSRFNADKSTDNTFGINGTNIANFGANSFGAGLVLQSDGRIAVGGYTDSAPKDFAAVARFNSNGFLDAGFGAGGKVTTSFGSGDDRYNALAAYPGSRIVAVGQSQNGANNDFAAARYLADASSTVPNRARFDFDGDGRADVSVYRSGVWYILQSLDNSFRAVQFGTASDLITPADYDADGRTDITVFRPSNGTWYGIRSSDNGIFGVQFGQNGDLPRPRDFSGDGKADIVVFRPSNGYWYQLTIGTNQYSTVQFGQAGDVPLVGDFDGDRVEDLGVYRSGVWYVRQSTNNGSRAVQFGGAADEVVPADYDGDGKTDFGVFRANAAPNQAAFYVLQNSNFAVQSTAFGAPTDVPVAADYDGDGKTDVAVFRPSNGAWYLNRTTSGFTGILFGQNGDLPIPNAY